MTRLLLATLIVFAVGCGPSRKEPTRRASEEECQKVGEYHGQYACKMAALSFEFQGTTSSRIAIHNRIQRSRLCRLYAERQKNMCIADMYSVDAKCFLDAETIDAWKTCETIARRRDGGEYRERDDDNYWAPSRVKACQQLADHIYTVKCIEAGKRAVTNLPGDYFDYPVDPEKFVSIYKNPCNSIKKNDIASTISQRCHRGFRRGEVRCVLRSQTSEEAMKCLESQDTE